MGVLIWNAKNRGSRGKNFCIINKNGNSVSERGLSAMYFVSVVTGSKTKRAATKELEEN